MSRTKRDVVKGRYRAASKKYDAEYKFHYSWLNIRLTPWGLLSHDEQMCVAPYSTPSWWNRLFNNRPSRLKDKKLMRHYDIGVDAEHDAEFSIFGKPHKYYW